MVNVLFDAIGQLATYLINIYNNNKYSQNCVYKSENIKNGYIRPGYTKAIFSPCHSEGHFQNTQTKIEGSDQ